jgi:hypothetical protein
MSSDKFTTSRPIHQEPAREDVLHENQVQMFLKSRTRPKANRRLKDHKKRRGGKPTKKVTGLPKYHVPSIREYVTLWKGIVGPWLVGSDFSKRQLQQEDRQFLPFRGQNRPSCVTSKLRAVEL